MRPGMEQMPSGAQGEGGEKTPPARLGCRGLEGLVAFGELGLSPIVPDTPGTRRGLQALNHSSSSKTQQCPYKWQGQRSLHSPHKCCISILFLSSLIENVLHLLLGPFQSPHGVQTWSLREPCSKG